MPRLLVDFWHEAAPRSHHDEVCYLVTSRNYIVGLRPIAKIRPQSCYRRRSASDTLARLVCGASNVHLLGIAPHRLRHAGY